MMISGVKKLSLVITSPSTVHTTIIRILSVSRLHYTHDRYFELIWNIVLYVLAVTDTVKLQCFYNYRNKSFKVATHG